MITNLNNFLALFNSLLATKPYPLWTLFQIHEYHLSPREVHFFPGIHRKIKRLIDYNNRKLEGGHLINLKNYGRKKSGFRALF